MFKPEELDLFTWLNSNSGRCKFNMSKNNMPDSLSRSSGIDFSINEYEKNRNEAKELFISALSKIYNVNSELIVPTISGSEAIYISMLLLRQHTDHITLFTPEYEPIVKVAKSLSFRLKEVNLLDIKAADLSESFSISLPNNPISITSDVIKRYLSEDLARPGMKYIDETFLEFSRRHGKTIFSESKGLVVSSTMTKFYGLSDMKVGWIFADREYIPWLKKTMDLITPSIPPYSLWISYQSLLNKEYFDRKVPEFINEKIEMVNEFIESTPGLEWTKPDGTTFGFVRTKESGSVDLCRRILKDTGVLLAPGKYFGDDHGFRIAYVMDNDSLRKALDLLNKYFVSQKN